MNMEQIAERIAKAGITRVYTATCNCKEHKKSDWVRVSPAQLAEIAFAAKIDFNDAKAYETLNHEVYNRVA